MSDRCKCRHTSAWHIGNLAGGHWTQERDCGVDGCPCNNFVSEDA